MNDNGDHGVSDAVTKQFNPFLGLRPYEDKHAHLFFGREGHTDDMIRKLSRHRFLAVVGSSGCGKSSLVGAGLLPALRRRVGQAKRFSGWEIAQMRPGNNPIHNLAQALGVIHQNLSKDERTIRSLLLESTLRRSSYGLMRLFKQEKFNKPLLVVVDQFEELFRYKNFEPQYQDQASAFVALLLEAIRQRDLPIYICITMRSDFFGDCDVFNGLPEAINAGQYLVPKMSRSERKSAVTRPMTVVGANMTNRLVQAMLNDLSDSTQDELPILQHALMRTYDRWRHHHPDNDTMDLTHYYEVGGVRNALNDHAENIFQQLSDEQKILIAKIFKNITLRSDNRDIRYPSIVKDLMEICEASLEDIAEVTAPFRTHQSAFLTPTGQQTLTEESIIDISHESLMRIWKRLRTWLGEEAESASTYVRLQDRAERNQKALADHLSGAELKAICRWQSSEEPNLAWSKRYGDNFELAMKFLADSQKNKDHLASLREEMAQMKNESNMLREQSELLHSVISHIPYSILWKDRQSILQGCNDLFAKTMGFDNALDIIGKNDEEVFNITKEQADVYRSWDKKVMDSGEPHLRRYREAVRKESKGVGIMIDFIPLKDTQGEVNGIMYIYSVVNPEGNSSQAMPETEEMA